MAVRHKRIEPLTHSELGNPLLCPETPIFREHIHLQKTKVGSKGEIFPPKEIREKLGLTPGTAVELKIEDSKLMIRPIPSVNELLKRPAAVHITLEEFHKSRRELSKKAESL